MTAPKLPRAISRDETEHGKLYYTRAQMIEYGRLCAEGVRKPVASKEEKSSYSSAIDELMRGMGMSK